MSSITSSWIFKQIYIYIYIYILVELGILKYIIIKYNILIWLDIQIVIGLNSVIIERALVSMRLIYRSSTPAWTSKKQETTTFSYLET